MTETVVITGASAGIGRATASLYGERGANVGLIARGQSAWTARARDVEDAGGKALADRSRRGRLRAGGGRRRGRWRSSSARSMSGSTSRSPRCSRPFAEISAEEFRRVTEVSYLGFVHGTMAALARMRPRGHGTIVQVGSALGSRSIPLQSAYCGAKHAINGFTSSLRCELLHEGSGVHVTVVQMPAVNTPQFSWVRSRLPQAPAAGAADLPARGGRPRRAVRRRSSPPEAVLGRRQHRGHDPGQPSRAPRCWTGTWPAPATTPSRPARRWTLAAGPTTCSRPSTGRASATTVRTACLTQRSHARSLQLWMAEHPMLVCGLAAGTALAAGVTAGRARAT